jgi:spermidine synthase
MTTPAEYAAAYAAVLKIAQADINQEVPAFFRSEIPNDFVEQFAHAAARVALDAAAAVRARDDQQQA